MRKQDVIKRYGGRPQDWRKVGKGWAYKDAVFPNNSIAVVRGPAVFRGGEFWGGVFRGGVFWNGEFMGGEFWGGEFWGGEFHRSPTVVYSRYIVCPTKPGWLKVGCEEHPFETWRTDGHEIAARHTAEDVAWYDRIVAPMIDTLIADAEDLFAGQMKE